MPNVKLYLKDSSGRDFGGPFSAVRVSTSDGSFLVDLEYAGSKASKRLGVASLSIDRVTMDELCRLYFERPWKERTTASEAARPIR
jgi:hypothetical protein